MRGRKPLPTHLKVVTGSEAPVNRLEPKPELALPDLPRHLAGEARKEWKRITPELMKLGLLTRIDRAALALYCTQWARYVNAENQMARLQDLFLSDAESGLVERTPQGYKMQSVWLQISNKASEMCLKFLTEFGMSPSARSRVQSTPQLGLFPDSDDASKKWNSL